MTVQFAAGGKQVLPAHELSRPRPGPRHRPRGHHVRLDERPVREMADPAQRECGNRARLSYQGKGNAGLVKQGDYYMSFSIDLTKS